MKSVGFILLLSLLYLVHLGTPSPSQNGSEIIQAAGVSGHTQIDSDGECWVFISLALRQLSGLISWLCLVCFFVQVADATHARRMGNVVDGSTAPHCQAGRDSRLTLQQGTKELIFLLT